MNVVILAAGKGSRMQSTLPKVLHSLAGEPLLGHVLKTARAVGASKLMVVYGHGGEAVRAAFSAASDVTWILQDPQLGTGDAVRLAIPELDPTQATLILYGDVPLLQVDSLLRLQAAQRTCSLALLTVTLDDPRGYGRIVRKSNASDWGGVTSAHGAIERIVEDKDATEAEKQITEVNTGILLADTPSLIRWVSNLRNNNMQREYYLTDIVAQAVAESTCGGGVEAVQPTDAWEVMGVNSRAQLAALERQYQAGIAAQLLAQGVGLRDPLRLDVRGELQCGTDVLIDVGCLFEGHVELAAGVEVGPYCILKNVSIGAGTKIAAYSMLEGACVGQYAVIGPYARLRPGTQLADNVHIGNFVEIKNSVIDKASKANHLAYIGDAQIGQRVNIGAGTITCNYDGVNKHKTVIGDDVFIGSDTQLVAPVTVGQGATLGAGTTLTKDAPAHALTISRVSQVVVPGWKRKPPTQ